MSRWSFLFRQFSILLAFVFVVSTGALFTNVQEAYAQEDSGSTTEDTRTDQKEDGTTCAIEKVGWILCPIMEGAAKIADKTFSVLANNFLQVEPKLLADDGAKPAWELARNLANIMFVIAFLAIVYSQITGSGLNNYGIKRMLPRLIIAAIAVNVSFYICQILVDISNIMGFAIKEALSAASNSVGPSVLGGSPQGLDTETGNGVLTYITIGALATAGVVWLILGPTALIITAVLVTALTVIVILLLRKAILVLLVVASPIAFVMYLLPNTEKLFDKWLKMFWGLLMVFPVVAALFGGGQLASTIILMAGASTPSQNANAEQCVADAEKENAEKTQAQKDADAVNDGYTIPCEGMLSISSPDSQETAQAGWMLGLVATGIAVAPLLAVWSVLKGALAAAGAIGGRIATSAQKGSGGIGKLGNKAYSKTPMGRGSELRKAGKEAFKNERFLEGLGDPNEEGIGRAEKNRRRFTRRAAGGASGLLPSQLQTKSMQAQQARIARAGAMGSGLQDKRDSEDIKNAMSAIEYSPKGKLNAASETLNSSLSGEGNAIEARAAINALMTSGEGGINALAAGLEHAQQTGNQKLVQAMKEYMLQAHGNVKEKNAGIAAWSKAGKDDAGRDDTRTVSDFMNSASSYSGLTDKQFASQTTNSMGSSGARSALAMATEGANGQMQTRGSRLLGNPENATELNDEKRVIISTASRSQTPPPAAPPTPPTPPPATS